MSTGKERGMTVQGDRPIGGRAHMRITAMGARTMVRGGDALRRETVMGVTEDVGQMAVTRTCAQPSKGHVCSVLQAVWRSCATARDRHSDVQMQKEWSTY